MTDLASLLAVASLQYRVNNLAQLDDGTWRANLRERGGEAHEAGPLFWEFGHGATPEEALREALAKAAEGPGERATRAPATVMTTRSAGSLGL